MFNDSLITPFKIVKISSRNVFKINYILKTGVEKSEYDLSFKYIDLSNIKVPKTHWTSEIWKGT